MDWSTLATEDFDTTLAAMPSLANTSRKPNRRSRRVQKKIDEQLALALADPVGWSTANRDGIRRASRRPRVAELLREAPELSEFDDQTHADGVTWLTAIDTGDFAAITELSDERKAKLHKWIQRAIPVLKVIAAICPPPWNLALIALIVVLTLIDKNRLTPKQIASIMAPEPTGEAVPTVAV